MCIDINECTGFLSGSNMPCDENAKDDFQNVPKILREFFERDGLRMTVEYSRMNSPSNQ